MDDYYCFFDRSAIDPLWNLSWQNFLRLHGRSRWAKGPDLKNGNDSLRGLIAFTVEPEPSAGEIEEIISRRTLRWTIQRSSPQFFVMGEIIYNVPSLRKFCVSLDLCPNDFAVLLAAAADGYFCGEIPESGLKTVLKLHYAKFDGFIYLNRKERSVLQRMINVEQYAKPIYPWQGLEAILDEQWAGCLGVGDTKRFFSLFDRLWKRNPEVTRVHDLEYVQLSKPEQKVHRFRDFGISRQLIDLWSRKVRTFEQPCVFRRWE